MTPTTSRLAAFGDRRLRRRLVGVATALLALLALLAVPVPADAQTGCPTGPLAFTSELTNGTLQIGRAASSSGNRATACGEIAPTAGGLTATIAPAGLVFAPGSTTVLFLKLPTRTSAVGPLTGPVSLGAGSIEASLTGPVVAEAKLLGFTCTIGPISPTLTTGTSGGLAGSPFVDDGTGVLRGRLVAADFTVPRIAASRSCPHAIAGLTNLLLGLPLSAGRSSIAFDASIRLGA